MSMDLQSNPVNELLSVSFNQDYSCVACGTESGFKVFNADPFRLTLSRKFGQHGGLGAVAMLFQTNIVALTGGGRSPRYQPNKVVLWDDWQERTVAELSFRSVVRSVRLRRDLVVVVLSKKIYVFGLWNLDLLDSIETCNNPKGLCCLSTGSDRAVLVCPGMQQGKALVVFYPKGFGEGQASVAQKRATIIPAHESPIAAMATDFSGSLLATASDKGTIVRVYDTSGGARRQELRRGADRAEIHSLAFNPSGEFLAVSSDKGTIHIFSVGGRRSSHLSSAGSLSLGGGAGGSAASAAGGSGGGGASASAPGVPDAGAGGGNTSADAGGAGAGAGAAGPSDSAAGAAGAAAPGDTAGSAGGAGAALAGPGGNAKSSLQRISRVLPAYFSSEWSLAQFRVPDYRCIAAFGTDPHIVLIVCANGSFYKARFDPVRGGEMKREEFVQLEDLSNEAATSGRRPSGSAPSGCGSNSASAAASPQQPPAPAPGNGGECISLGPLPDAAVAEGVKDIGASNAAATAASDDDDVHVARFAPPGRGGGSGGSGGATAKVAGGRGGGASAESGVIASAEGEVEGEVEADPCGSLQAGERVEAKEGG